MSSAPRRKSGPLANRRRLARQLLRDRRIYRKLRHAVLWSKHWHDLYREPVEALSVYAGVPGHRHPRKLTAFPVTTQDNGHKMPGWDDLSAWLKCQVLVMALEQWHLQTFTVHLHKDLARHCADSRKDPREVIRDRMRKRLKAALGRSPEFFFVVEGWSKARKVQVKLHIHGAVFMDGPSEEAKVMDAIAKACGQGLRGVKRERRSVHGKLYWRDGPRYVDYLFKSVKRPDDRLSRRRSHMSREAVGAAREMWGLMTEPR